MHILQYIKAYKDKLLHVKI